MNSNSAFLIKVGFSPINKAYQAELVMCDWAGSVLQILPKKCQKSKCVINQQTAYGVAKKWVQLV